MKSRDEKNDNTKRRNKDNEMRRVIHEGGRHCPATLLTLCQSEAGLPADFKDTVNTLQIRKVFFK